MIWDIYKRVNAAFLDGDLDTALLGAVELTRLFPKEAIGYSAAVSYLVALDRLDEAETFAIRGLQMAGQDRWILHWAAEIPRKKADWSKAEARLQRIIELFPDHSPAYRQFFDCLLAQDDKLRIEHFIQRFVGSVETLQSADMALRIKIAGTLTSSGNLIAAAIIWASVPELDGVQSLTYLHAAAALFADAVTGSDEDLQPGFTNRLLTVLAREPVSESVDWIPKLYVELRSLRDRDKPKFKSIIKRLSGLRIEQGTLSPQNFCLREIGRHLTEKQPITRELRQKISTLQSHQKNLLCELYPAFQDQILHTKTEPGW